LQNHWAIDLDIKGFFDNIDHGLLVEGSKTLLQRKWVLMYVERWLKADIMQATAKTEQTEWHASRRSNQSFVGESVPACSV
jgi:retron-type reverse transcriptase